MITAVGGKRVGVVVRAVFGAVAAALVFPALMLAGCGGDDGGDKGGDPNDQGDPSGTTFVDSRDGTRYKKVTIGTQTWMAENLNYNPYGSRHRCYDDSPDSCAKYGRLYTWYMAMDDAASSKAVPSGVRGVCPEGWHLPSDAEWTVLMDYVADSLTVGTKLKSAIGWNSYEGIPAGTDDYGFSALPGGRCSGTRNSSYAGDAGSWWSATEMSASANYISISHDYEKVWRLSLGKTFYLSVRCIQN